MSEFDINVIPGTERYEVSEPTFSPDGRTIAFFSIADEKIMTIPLDGGVASPVCDTPTPNGISWGNEGIVFGRVRKANTLVTSSTLTDGVMLVSAKGGTPRAIVRVTEGQSAYGPQMLPGGTHVLYTLATGNGLNRWDKAHMIVQSLTDDKRTDLGEGSDARYLEPGYLIYAVSGSVYAVAFDLPTRTPKGDPAVVFQGVRRASGNFTGAAALSIAKNGTAVYIPGPLLPFGSAPMDLALMDRAGTVKELTLDPPGFYSAPRVSRDGAHAAFEADDGTIYTVELSGRTLMQPLTTGDHNRFPLWAWDNRHVAFQSDRGGDLGIWWQTLDGQPQRLRTADPGTSLAPESWFEDTLLYSVTSDTGVSLRTLSLLDRTEGVVDTEGSSAPIEATISHDGKLLAYTITKGSHVTLYVQAFPSGRRYPITAPPSDTPKHPRWMTSSRGRELCFDPNVKDFACVPVISTESVAFGNPSTVPKHLQLSPPYTRTPYDVTEDGQFVGFVVAGTGGVERGLPPVIQVVLNWHEELKRLAPRR